MSNPQHFTKKEFAIILNCSTRELAVYASPKRGKITYTPDGMVDGSLDKHLAFVALKRGKDGLSTPKDLRSLLPPTAPKAARKKIVREKKAKPVREPKPAKATPLKRKEDLVVTEKDFDDEDANLPTIEVAAAFDVDKLVDKEGRPLLTLAESERLKKHNDAYLAEANLDIATMKKHRMQALVVPASFIAPIFAQHNHFLLTNFNSGIEEILRKFCKIADLSSEEQAMMKGESVKALNEAMDNAIKASELKVERAIEEFMDAKK